MALFRALSILTVLLAITGCTSSGSVTRYPAAPRPLGTPAVAPAPRQPVVTTQPLGPRDERIVAPLGAPPPVPGPVQPQGVAPGVRHVAVLLPRSGAHQQSAQAIRAGILAAWYADSAPGKPELRFFDTAGGVASAYRTALAGGAERVIGPLLKEEIASLTQEGELAVPTLVLNRIDGVQEHLFQFALLPEDDLEQVADLARRDGHIRALLLAPAAPLGQRMIQHFSEYWRQAGGQIAAIVTYPPNEGDYAATVGKLRAADSRADFLLLAGADARDARLIVPRIQELDSRRLPVYATSHLFGGKPDPQHDRALSGVLFCDGPAVLGGVVSSDDWPEAAALPRLFAMGQDAWQIARRLDSWNTAPGASLPGASGALSLRAGNRVHRRLSCARFEQGEPVPQGLAPEKTPQPAPLPQR
jgi:outer membrane PBP1 activator LpoA protein